MSAPLNNELSDMDKLWSAFSTITDHFSSVDSMLEAIGLANLPTAQRYGILFGIITFVCTVSAVISLLIMGGSFERIKEQTRTGSSSVPSVVEARNSRPLLLERLVEARERMMKQNYSDEKKITQGYTNLTKMMVNIAPGVKAKEVAELVGEDGNKRESGRSKIPEGYVEEYCIAYRTCMDKPGGPMLNGLPEARFEAYARAYAGCGLFTSTNYRRSYARLYETMACQTHAMEKKFSNHFDTRPEDIVGRVVRLEPLEAERHAQILFDITCGEIYQQNKSFNPDEVWGFQEAGPFKNAEEMKNSFVFQRRPNESAFAIVENLTDRVIGCVMLTNDNPAHLNISIEAPIVKPSSQGTVEQLEACFLLMDRLFALGYRRIQLALDSGDLHQKKLPGRLGFTQEGIIPKHMIIKESSRDSLIYGMLNSDWDKGARSFLYKKLHGAKLESRDKNNNDKEAELEAQKAIAKEREEKEADKQMKK
mmetsp:Transcript_7488/g.11317  ORF Transcript_7488/g.11317 Transcript_7488/m.11317 type:complete len:479 (-) Transcript_7488:66-1502(-)|eukprot:CAMPEP_0195284934 /NCGR_PEP_ID=MMETSP0707-20130614/2949_1 /TAXON_ID=33640 /ORGANISM="Asterionellopsis glacialis, Strain CCMP134" /LENGTH=478 /DNA_ID=CAMNT_0040344343 /DNA_START=84 /DNA_END=1520 /DNA_ORIENTATION=-